MTLSIHARLIIAAAVVMVFFFGITGWILQSIYREDAETALQDRLQSDVYTLIAAGELDDDGILRLSYILPDARFFTTNSNVYAQITSNDQRQSWQSASLSRITIPFVQNLVSAERRFERLTASNGQGVYAFSLGVAWLGNSAMNGVFTVSVAYGLRDFTHKIENFQRSLWTWLGGVALLLLIVQSAILRWALVPLTRMAQELRAIELGQRRNLGGDYPRELHAVTQNINTLIGNRHELIKRYRNSLGDLAHSLKTPLAVLRGISEAPTSKENTDETLREQVDHMSRIVGYQLQKAAASGSATLTTPVNLLNVTQKIVKTLRKVYADKDVQCSVEVDGHTTFHGDEGDLIELLGNLLDNAFKWCRKNVTIGVHTTLVAHTHPDQIGEIILTITDDGPGIPADMVERVIERGIRADPNTAGHGIGLAVAHDLVKLYKGALRIEQNSAGGGTKVIVKLRNP